MGCLFLGTDTFVLGCNPALSGEGTGSSPALNSVCASLLKSAGTRGRGVERVWGADQFWSSKESEFQKASVVLSISLKTAATVSRARAGGVGVHTHTHTERSGASGPLGSRGADVDLDPHSCVSR